MFMPLYTCAENTTCVCRIRCMVVAECLSTRLWIRDLFLGCAYVRTCRSRLGMSICGHAWNVNLRSCPGPRTQASLDTCITRDGTFLGNGRRGGRGGQCGWPFTTYVFCGVKCINECWTQPTAADSEKKKRRSQSTIDAKRVTEEPEFKSRKHVLEILHKPGI